LIGSGVIEFAIGQQSSIGSDDRPSKLEDQSAVEIEPENTIAWFTRRVLGDGLMRFKVTY
jgi:hypothetical protein